MKRTIIAAGALALAGGLLFMSDARAESPECAEGDTEVDIQIGLVCAGGSPEEGTGHVYADGNNDNPNPLGGYIGVNNDDPDTADGALVGCANGDYHTDDLEVDTDGDGVPDEGDGDADPNVIVDFSDPGSTSPDPESECNPSPGG